MTKRPSITSPCVADRHATGAERIAEFSTTKGNGGLFAVREMADGSAQITLYRLDQGTVVFCPADAYRPTSPGRTQVPPTATDSSDYDANIPAVADAARAMLAALEQAKALTYEGADRLHKMTMKEKARFLAASLVAVAAVTAPAIAQAKAAGITP